ncbi:ATP-dependent zinc metalloprotease FtsH [Leptogranulimonas caecicola]|uniref:ATP-dependent zinc metalloprotease FtsH n=1 Tax=Leptogranulimonas caecicola TaxID=2894156 RepID=A0AAU9CIN8_9ACTN|nr:ATP-dependent zinc metalloprotease FtsH [Leptogranulimonas caecicola]BCV18551.1 cell division protein FtsH [Atopobiaceae bacterium P1]BDC90881.1 cell division protein FtsH [Leptogranulimonas caecicola]
MDNKKKRQSMMLYIIIALIVFAILRAFVYPSVIPNTVKETDYSTFISMVDDNKVNKVQLNTETGSIVFVSGEGDNAQTYRTNRFPGDDTLVERLEKHNVEFAAEIPDGNDNFWLALLLYGFPFILILLGGWALNRQMKKAMGDDGPSMSFGGGGLGNFGKSGAKVVAEKETGVTFKDVAGQDEAKESLAELVSFLEKPQRYEAIGAKLPRGALLVGPPGTGKTLLAKAVAGEAKVPFFSISGSEFVEMFVGRGAAKVRDLFKQANEKAPCIVFIDEIDTVGKRRDAGLSTNDEREQTLNQLLTEMDGFDNHKGIVVIGATNRPDTLDPALLRPGRFDRRVPVELPDLAGRKAILALHANDVKMTGDIDLDVIARATPGASGADLSNIINEAALRAVRMGRNRVTQEDIQESVEVVIAGEKRKSTVLSEREKKIVAYHEIGHAMVAAAQKGSAPVSKITIVPRTSGALGYTMQVEDDEHYLVTKEEAMEQIAVMCGGRSAEELIFKQITTGASNDIERATKLARNMVTQYGMSDKFGMVALGQVQNRYLSGDASLTCSEGTAQEIDEEVMHIVEEAHQNALKILRENLFKLHELARYLQVKETITGEEFMNIFTRDNDYMPKPDAQ